MRPRRQSIDSETSSDSWSVIQKNVTQPETSSVELIDFEPTDSEHWDSDSDSQSVQDLKEYDSSEDDDSDSLEECDESDGVDDEERGDCEIVDENEAMEESSSRYFVSSEKVYQLFDMLSAECCSSIGEALKCTWASSRDSTRAAVLLIFVITTTIFFTSSARVGKTRSAARSDEIFAPGLQSREDFERAFMPLLPRRAPLNSSKVCQPWQKTSWSLPPGWSAPIEPPTGLASYASQNDTSILELNDIFLFTRPVVKTGARISISRPAKARRNVCSEPAVRRHGGVYPRSLKVNTIRQNKREDEPIRPPRPPPRLAAAPISISRTAKLDGSVCTEKSKPLSKLQYPKSILLKRKVLLKNPNGLHRPQATFMKPKTGPRRQLINFMKPKTGPRRPSISFMNHKPCIAKKSNISALVRAVPRSLTLRKQRPTIAPCLLRNRPCAERNTTRKPCKGSKALLASPPTRQVSLYKRRMAPSLPPLPRRPCVQRSDAVQCWKSLQDQIKPSKSGQYDWFTRRGQVRAENRRH